MWKWAIINKSTEGNIAHPIFLESVIESLGFRTRTSLEYRDCVLGTYYGILLTSVLLLGYHCS